MKNIEDYMLRESYKVTIGVDNIILSGSGSMYTDGLDIAEQLQKIFKDAKLFIYDTKDEKVIPLKDINDYEVSGPHSKDLSGLTKFYYDHAGEMTLFIQN